MTGNRPTPSYGVIFFPSFPPETLADYARRAEAGGFDELWLWDDCFEPGALTSAAIALSATTTLKVGIGLMPATAYNPLFAAMEITTLARAFPGRILPGIGHGVASWMARIGAAPRSSLKSLGETVTAVRALLAGERVTVQGEQVRLDQVQMSQTPAIQPPLYVGGMREKTLKLAGRVGDGTILTANSSPAYVRWALGHIRAGMAESGRTGHKVAVFYDVCVSAEGEPARAAARQALSKRLPWVETQVDTIGGGLKEFIQARGAEGIANDLPDEWLDALTASGTPDQVLASLLRLADAGADSIIFQPLEGDPGCLDEYVREILPKLRN